MNSFLFSFLCFFLIYFTLQNNNQKTETTSASIFETNSSTENIITNEETKTETTPLIPFSEDGIKLSHLQEFINDCGGRERLKDLTIQEVLEIIKTLTLSSQKSYCGMLKDQNKNGNEGIVGKADRFLSNSHHDKFLEIVDLLTLHYQNQSSSKNQNNDPIIWWDIFSINQHQEYPFVDMNIDTWSSTFGSVIKSIGHTILPLLFWNNVNLTPFTEIHCEQEIYYTFKIDSNFEVIMTNDCKNQLIQSFIRNPASEIQNLLKMFDVVNLKKKEESTSVTNQYQYQSFLNLIKSSVGIFTFDITIFQIIRNYVTFLIEKDFEEHPNDKRYNNALGILYYSQQRNEEAEFHCNVSYEHAKQLSPGNRGTLTRMDQLGLVYLQQQKYQQAIELFSNCYKTRKEVLGKDHVDTIESMFNLAVAYIQQGDEENRAEHLLIKSGKLRYKILGKTHPDTIRSMNELGLYYFHRENYDQAEPLLKEVVKAYRETVGITNNSTIQALKTLSSLFEKKELYSIAMSHLLEIHAYAEQLYGLKSSFGLDLLYRISKMYLELNEIQRCESFVKQCYQMAIQESHGNSNILTAKLVYLYGEVNFVKQDYVESSKIFRVSLELFKNTSSESSEEVLNCLNSLGSSYYHLEEYEKSQETLKACYNLIQQHQQQHHQFSHKLYPIISLNLQHQIQNLLKNRDYDLAMELNEKRYNLCLQKYDKNHKETMKIIETFIEITREAKNYKKCIKYLKMLKEIKEKEYGSPHSEVVKVKYELIQVYRENNQHKQADELMKSLRCYSMNIKEDQSKENITKQEEQEQEQEGITKEEAMKEEQIQSTEDQVI